MKLNVAKMRESKPQQKYAENNATDWIPQYPFSNYEWIQLIGKTKWWGLNEIIASLPQWFLKRGTLLSLHGHGETKAFSTFLL